MAKPYPSRDCVETKIREMAKAEAVDNKHPKPIYFSKGRWLSGCSSGALLDSRSAPSCCSKEAIVMAAIGFPRVLMRRAVSINRAQHRETVPRGVKKPPKPGRITQNDMVPWPSAISVFMSTRLPCGLGGGRAAFRLAPVPAQASLLFAATVTTERRVHCRRPSPRGGRRAGKLEHLTAAKQRR